MKKKKVLFIFRHEYENLWQDGLWAALLELSHTYEISLHNILKEYPNPYGYDFILGWGAFGSAVDKYMRTLQGPKGLCVAGVVPGDPSTYDVIFYETEWYGNTIEHRNMVHAFGINTDIYKSRGMRKLWDYTTVGAFSLWKRQELLLKKVGVKLAIGEIQKGNPQESMGIIAKLLAGGVFVADMVDPKILSKIYSMTETVYIPATVHGGGERAVLEARACGCNVDIELDNSKLAELLLSPIYDHHYYASKLKEGINSCL